MACFLQLACNLSVLLFFMVSINSQYVNYNLPPNFYYQSPAPQWKPYYVSPAVNVKIEDKNYLADNTVGVIAKPVKSILGGVGNLVGKAIGGASQIVGNTVQSVGGAITSGRPITGTVSAVGNIIGGSIKPIEDIVSAGAGLSTGTVSEVLNIVKDKVRGIYPGTRWCGDGDRASNIEDLGLFYKTDACCRNHDLCRDNIKSGETKYGLFNEAQFTRSHCDCDAAFYNCLKNSGSIVATKIGITFFNILSPKCFKLEYPAVCIQTGRTLLLKEKCTLYSVNYYQPPVWQWFDSVNF